jgi:hypothetical protein
VANPEVILGDGEGAEAVFGASAEVIALDAFMLWGLCRWQVDVPGDVLILNVPELAAESGDLLSEEDIRRVVWFWRACGIVRSVHQEREGDDSTWCAVAGRGFLDEPILQPPPALDRDTTA